MLLLLEKKGDKFNLLYGEKRHTVTLLVKELISGGWWSFIFFFFCNQKTLVTILNKMRRILGVCMEIHVKLGQT